MNLASRGLSSELQQETLWQKELNCKLICGQNQKWYFEFSSLLGSCLCWIGHVPFVNPAHNTYEWRPWTPPSTWAEVVLFSNFSSPEYIIALAMKGKEGWRWHLWTTPESPAVGINAGEKGWHSTRQKAGKWTALARKSIVNGILIMSQHSLVIQNWHRERGMQHIYFLVRLLVMYAARTWRGMSHGSWICPLFHSAARKLSIPSIHHLRG